MSICQSPCCLEQNLSPLEMEQEVVKLVSGFGLIAAIHVMGLLTTLLRIFKGLSEFFLKPLEARNVSEELNISFQF